MRRKQRHPRGSVIAYIWIGVFVVAVLLAAFFQDDDPNTDEASGAGALMFVGGGALTVAYLVLAGRLNSRNPASGGGDESSATPADPRSWVRRNRGPLIAGAGAIIVLVVAGALAPSPDTAERTTEPTTVNAEPGHAPTKGELVATIRAAASEASSARRITSVDCMDPLVTTTNVLLSCAVTYEGPACQLWLAGGADDYEPVAMGEPGEGLRGRADEKMAHCE